jgi:hypothetical protein
MFQFSVNLKKIKRKTIEWAKEKFKGSSKAYLGFKEDITTIFKSNMNDISSE